MKFTKLAGPTLIACTLAMSGAMSGAAHAESADQILDGWAKYVKDSFDRLTPDRRETYVRKLTDDARKSLAQVACKNAEEATRTTSHATQVGKDLPIKFTYVPSCDLTLHKMKVNFLVTEFAKDTPQDSKLDAANIERIKHTLENWGNAAKKAVNETHEPKKTKAEIDSATSGAASIIAMIPCRHTAEVSIENLVEKEVKKQGLDMDPRVSSECDAQKHTWKISFTVAEVRIPFNAAKDAGGVDSYKKRLVDVTVDTMFNDVKTWTQSNKVPVALDKQRNELAERLAFHTKALNATTCKVDPADTLAVYLKDAIRTKAAAARDYIAISPQKIDVQCDRGHLAVTLADAMPVLPPTIKR